MTGMQSFGRKEKREQRRRNHIARDLHTPKYKQRIKQGKKKDRRQVEENDDGYWFVYSVE